MATISEIQARLVALGFAPSTIKGRPFADGIWGRLSIAALEDFQTERGLTVNGIADAATVKSLFPKATAAQLKKPQIPWFDELMRRKGLHEVKNKAELSKFLKSDGAFLGDPAKFPWCGDAVQTIFAITLPREPMVTNPYWAANWDKFGIKCEPTLGCVLRFSRPGGGGHVGLYAGEDKTHYFVLGGNQSNSISVARIAKSRLKSSRWPATVPLGAIVKGAAIKGAVVTQNEA